MARRKQKPKQKRKFLVSVDIHVIRHVEYEVEATGPEEAAELVRDGEGKSVDPEDSDLVGDDFDVRYVTDPEAEKVYEF
jgi:hypothetical protein